MSLDPQKVAHNLKAIQQDVAEAAARANRSLDEVEILAAVKYVPLSDLGALVEAGITLVGENRAQDLVAKEEAYPGRFRWHFIGQLQSRKVKQILPYVDLIHSVASESALRQLGTHGTPETRILLEVNISEEEGKAGIAPADLPHYLDLAPVAVVGLMTMPPPAEDPASSRPYFRALQELAAKYGLEHLSMGTSQDYSVAVEEGATIVRIGSVLYS